jgi:hypothetical protein
VSGEVLWIATEKQRERFHTVRKRGGQCAACGRKLSPGEPVYIEQFEFSSGSGHATTASGPVGGECVSRGFAEEVEDCEPERCAGCGRGVYYRVMRTNRRRAACSRACLALASVAERRQQRAEQ